MSGTTLKLNPSAPGWLRTAVGGALFLIVAIILHGILLQVEYRWARVLDITTVAGRDMHHRAVLVETPERLRVLRTSDRLLRIQKGDLVCLSDRRMIARQWRRHALELPGYCRNIPRPAPQASVLSAD